MEQFRRAHRPQHRRVIGGVAAGIAEHSDIPVVVVRAIFVIAGLFYFLGVFAYLILWRFLPLQESDEPQDKNDLIQGISLLMLGVAAAMLLEATQFGLPILFELPIGIAVIGVAVVWRQLDDAPKRSTSQTVAQFLIGFAVLATAAIYFLSQNTDLSLLAEAIGVVVVATVGLTIILGTWVTRVVAQLGAERAERSKAEARAEIAAHLHDSVLQTLVLLQKNAADRNAVSTLARKQERELREWLYGSGRQESDSMSGLLKTTAAEVENDYGVVIEVVVVGDGEVNERRYALVQALREAMVNAAKHAKSKRIDVFAEINEDGVESFVRDRGIGFEPDAVAEGRHGISHSIIERMKRHGGEVKIQSTVGEGTEIQIIQKDLIK